MAYVTYLPINRRFMLDSTIFCVKDLAVEINKVNLDVRVSESYKINN